jgi:hypothetical protein
LQNVVRILLRLIQCVVEFHAGFCKRKPEAFALFIISFSYNNKQHKTFVTCKSYFKTWFISIAYIRGGAIWDTEI